MCDPLGMKAEWTIWGKYHLEKPNPSAVSDSCRSRPPWSDEGRWIAVEALQLIWGSRIRTKDPLRIWKIFWKIEAIGQWYFSELMRIAFLLDNPKSVDIGIYDVVEKAIFCEDDMG